MDEDAAFEEGQESDLQGSYKVTIEEYKSLLLQWLRKESAEVDGEFEDKELDALLIKVRPRGIDVNSD